MDVVGDPVAMQAAAGVLRLRADQVVETARSMADALGDAVYEGPAAERLRAAGADRYQRLVAVACQLQDLADTLTRSVADIAETRAEAARAALLAQESGD